MAVFVEAGAQPVELLSLENEAAVDRYYQAQAQAKASASDAYLRALEAMRSGDDSFMDVMPYIDGQQNSQYEKVADPAEQAFLRTHLTGSVLDIGGNGIELGDAVPPERATYLDIVPFDVLPITDDERRVYADKYLQADVAALPFADATASDGFDSLYSSNVVQTSSAPTLLPEMLRVLRPGGSLVMRPLGDAEDLRSLVSILATMDVDMDTLQVSCSQPVLRHAARQIECISAPSLTFAIRKAQKEDYGATQNT